MQVSQFEVWSNWNFEDSCNKADNLYLQPKKLTMRWTVRRSYGQN